VTSKPDFKVMVLLLVFMQLTRDLFAIAKFLYKDNTMNNLRIIHKRKHNTFCKVTFLFFSQCNSVHNARMNVTQWQ